MKKYLVTLVLIVGYYDSEYENPKLKDVEYEIMANNEDEAIYEAKFNRDKSHYSVWEAYATEI